MNKEKKTKNTNKDNKNIVIDANGKEINVSNADISIDCLNGICNIKDDLIG